LGRETDQAAWGALDDKTITMRWIDLETGTGQTLTVEASIRLRQSDGKAEWSIRGSLSAMARAFWSPLH